MSRLEVIDLPLAHLRPYCRNARVHSQKQIAQIAASIRTFGFNNPVLIDNEGTITAGHGRVAAVKLLGLEVVPVIRLEHMSEAQKRAYILADNKLAEKAGWDAEILAIELQNLLNTEFKFGLAVTGFEMPEIDVLIAGLDRLFYHGCAGPRIRCAHLRSTATESTYRYGLLRAYPYTLGPSTNPSGSGWVYGYAGGSLLVFIDKDGRFIWMPALIGAGANLGAQLLIQYRHHKDLKKALKCVDWGDVVLSGFFRGIGGPSIFDIMKVYKKTMSATEYIGGLAISGFTKKWLTPIPATYGSSCECKASGSFLSSFVQ